MKNLIIFLIMILFFSCNPYLEREWDKLPELLLEWDEINSFQDIEVWIFSNIKYKKDNKDYWQFPDETILKETGDCEDMALLFCAMSNKLLHKKPMLAKYYYTNYNKYHVESIYNKIEYMAKLKGNSYLINLWNYNEIAFEIEMHRF